jgi:hypothetical protein
VVDFLKTGMVLIITTIMAGVTVAQPQPTSEGYRVRAYDGRTHQYTIHRDVTFDGKYMVKKIVMICKLYQIGNYQPVTDATVCELPIGKFYPSHRPREEKGGFLLISEQNDRLSITEGIGANRILQSFTVLSIEVLPDLDCRLGGKPATAPVGGPYDAP